VLINRMARLPDRFDLWVRKARECPDPARQADYVLGALAALPDWHLFNRGTPAKPVPAEAELEGGRHLLVFSDPERIEELLSSPPPAPVISIPTVRAFPWCLEQADTAGLLVNPGEDGFIVAMDQLHSFYRQWREDREVHSTGYWIPNLTTEEEDFWQEHGL
jgi:hypothetical protein